MRELSILHPPPVFVEFGPAWFRAACEDRGIELPLERTADGRLTEASREKMAGAVKGILGRKSWQPRARAVCGIGAQGVLLRRLALPAAAQEDFERVLRLKIESEFPLSPEELAWGWRGTATGAAGREVLVAAVRKEVIEDYAAALLAAGANPEFTVAALARDALCPPAEAAHAILDISSSHAELVSFTHGVPDGVRVFPITAGLDVILKGTTANIIYVSGMAAAQDKILAGLPPRMQGRRLEGFNGAGGSAAILGLQKTQLASDALLWLRVKPKPAKTAYAFFRPEIRPQLVRTLALLVVLLLLPVAETLVLKPFLGWRLATFKSAQQKFTAVVDPELQFLLYLKQNQPPYLDALYLFAKAAPPGMHLDSFSVNQKGAIAVKASLPNGQQVTDFREKMIASGFFASLAVEEQTPVPNQQKVNVRMTAQWKPAGARTPVLVSAPTELTETNKPGGKAGPQKP